MMTNKNKESKDTSSDNKARSEESGKKRAIKTPSEENIDFSKRNTIELDFDEIRNAAGKHAAKSRREPILNAQKKPYPQNPSDTVTVHKRRKKPIYILLAVTGLIIVIGAAATAGYIAGVIGSLRPTVDLSENVTLNTDKALRYSPSENRYTLDLTNSDAFTISVEKPVELKITNSAWDDFLNSFQVKADKSLVLSALKNGDTLTVRIRARSDSPVNPKDFAIEHNFRYTGTDKNIHIKVSGLPTKYSDAGAFINDKKPVIKKLLTQAEKKAGKQGTVTDSRLYFAKPLTDTSKHNDVLCIFIKTTGKGIFDTRWRSYFITPVTDFLNINTSSRRNHSLKEGSSSILLIKSRLDLLTDDQIEKGTGYEISAEIDASALK